MSCNFSIFDFDLTISIEHTFANAQLQKADISTISASPDYKKRGFKDAQSNVKANLPLELMDLSGGNLFAIATFHNNPDYIAGYLEHIWGREITTDNQVFYSKAEPKVAVKEFHVKGISKPLLISYLPKVEEEFQRFIWLLNGKNNQIQLLVDLATEKKLLADDYNIDFFDDSFGNIEKVSQLADLNISAYQVKDGRDFELVRSDKPLEVLKNKYSAVSEPSELITVATTSASNSSDWSQNAKMFFTNHTRLILSLTATSLSAALVFAVAAIGFGASLGTSAAVSLFAAGLVAGTTFFTGTELESAPKFQTADTSRLRHHL